MKQILFVEQARQELLSQVAYYNEQQPLLGARFLSEIEGAVSLISAFPHVGAERISGVRQIYLKSFPFAVVYKPSKDQILIYAIAHNSRYPCYWNDRR